MQETPVQVQFSWTSLVAQSVKKLPAVQDTWVRSLGWGDPLEKKMATHSRILAWRIPRTEEPGRLQSTGWQRVGQDWVTNYTHTHTHTHTHRSERFGENFLVDVYWAEIGSEETERRVKIQKLFGKKWLELSAFLDVGAEGKWGQG